MFTHAKRPNPLNLYLYSFLLIENIFPMQQFINSYNSESASPSSQYEPPLSCQLLCLDFPNFILIASPLSLISLLAWFGYVLYLFIHPMQTVRALLNFFQLDILMYSRSQFLVPFVYGILQLGCLMFCQLQLKTYIFHFFCLLAYFKGTLWEFFIYLIANRSQIFCN